MLIPPPLLAELKRPSTPEKGPKNSYIPKIAGAWSNRGLLPRRNIDYRDAISDWEKLLKRVPDYRKAADYRAAIRKMRAQLKKQNEK